MAVNPCEAKDPLPVGASIGLARRFNHCLRLYASAASADMSGPYLLGIVPLRKGSATSCHASS